MKLFYIAPHYLDSEFEKKIQILQKLSSKKGIEVLKGIKVGKNKFDSEKTMELYQEADFFIADLSYQSPSCYYEVGYNQGLNRLVKLIALKGTIIHQVKGEVHFYSNLKEYEQLIKLLLERKKTATNNA